MYSKWIQFINHNQNSDEPNSTIFLMHKENIIGAVHINHTLNGFNKLIGGHISLSIKPSKRGNGHGKQMMRFWINVPDIIKRHNK